MILNVNRKQVTVLENPFRLCADSSDLGLSPGRWPEFIAVTDEKDEGFLFERGAPKVSEIGELQLYHYSTKSGIQLVVFND